MMRWRVPAREAEGGGPLLIPEMERARRDAELIAEGLQCRGRGPPARQAATTRFVILESYGDTVEMVIEGS